MKTSVVLLLVIVGLVLGDHTASKTIVCGTQTIWEADPLSDQVVLWLAYGAVIDVSIANEWVRTTMQLAYDNIGFQDTYEDTHEFVRDLAMFAKQIRMPKSEGLRGQKLKYQLSALYSSCFIRKQHSQPYSILLKIGDVLTGGPYADVDLYISRRMQDTWALNEEIKQNQDRLDNESIKQNIRDDIERIDKGLARLAHVHKDD